MSASTPYLNRDRRGLMHAIDNSHVRISAGGRTFWRRRTGANNVAVATRVRELETCNWASLGDDGRTWTLTETGRHELATFEAALPTSLVVTR